MSCTKLAPPGAGLPKSEAFLIRHLVFPTLRMRLSREKSVELFESTGREILSLAEPLNLEELTSPVLIPRLPGMEDSSRNWSVELTLEHIQVVTAAALFIITKLEANEPLDLPVRTEDVKPSGGLGLDRVRSFREYLEETPAEIAKFEFKSKATHLHPWFGELKSLDWLRLLAFHQDLHRKQIHRILQPPVTSPFR